MSELKGGRWQQRFQNFERAYKQLQRGLDLDNPSDIEQQGVIQSFEFTFELAWKTLKDYLAAQGVECSFPREVIKQAFHYQIIHEGTVWLDMLAKRNLLAHTYDETIALEAYSLITTQYAPLVKLLLDRLSREVTDEISRA